MEQKVEYISQISELGNRLGDLIPKDVRYFILTDSNTAEHCLPMLEPHLPDGGKDMMLMSVPAGEESKSLQQAETLYKQLMDYGADRENVLVNLGGGMVTDLGGFVASTFKRGIPFIHIPTSVLSQVDAAIGGKTGVNVAHFKNMAGTFAPANHILICDAFLVTLSKRHVMAGFAETIKHALIADAGLWERIKTREWIDLPFIRSLIQASAKIKADVVQEDFLEKGRRKTLNFGHTIGHALETFSFERGESELIHGEAVALGMMAESHIAYSKGLLNKEHLESISALISKWYPSPRLVELTYHRIIEIMRKDKKNKEDHIRMALIDDIGSCRIDVKPKMSHIIDALIYMQRYPFGN